MTQIRLGVAVLVVNADGALLLGRRGKEPNYGKWIIPGGGIQFGEHWADAARRELLEETGLQVEVWLNAGRPYVLEILGPDEHRVILCVRGRATGGTLKAGSDLLEVRFFDNLPADVSPAVRPALAAFGWASP